MTPTAPRALIPRVLIPFDFSPAARAALDVVRTRFPGAPAELLHVVPGRDPRAPGSGADFPREREELAALGGGTLAYGAPAEEILRCARSGRFDLIALGRVGARGPGRGRLGAVAERVLQGSPLPVLSVPAGPEVPASPQFRALVLMDFSPGALGARGFLGRFWPDAEVENLHVVDRAALDVPFPLPGLRSPPALRGASTRLIQERNALWEQEARRRLDDLGGGHLAWGSPAEVALERVRQGGYGVIALGASAKRGLDLLMFGSVARRLVRESPLPVLTARMAEGELT